MPAQYIPTHAVYKNAQALATRRRGTQYIPCATRHISCAVYVGVHALRGTYPAQSPTRVPLGYCAGHRAVNMLRPALEVAIKTSKYCEGYGRIEGL